MDKHHRLAGEDVRYNLAYESGAKPINKGIISHPFDTGSRLE